MEWNLVSWYVKVLSATELTAKLSEILSTVVVPSLLPIALVSGAIVCIIRSFFKIAVFLVALSIITWIVIAMR